MAASASGSAGVIATLSPQPQAEVSLGLRKVKVEDSRSTLKSISEPSRNSTAFGSIRTLTPLSSMTSSSGVDVFPRIPSCRTCPRSRRSYADPKPGDRLVGVGDDLLDPRRGRVGQAHHLEFEKVSKPLQISVGRVQGPERCSSYSITHAGFTAFPDVRRSRRAGDAAYPLPWERRPLGSLAFPRPRGNPDERKRREERDHRLHRLGLHGPRHGQEHRREGLPLDGARPSQPQADRGPRRRAARSRRRAPAARPRARRSCFCA